MAIDWTAVYQKLGNSDFAEVEAMLARQSAADPDGFETAQLGFAIYAQQRNIVKVGEYLDKLKGAPGLYASEVLAARARHADIMADWDAHAAVLKEAMGTEPIDVGLVQQAICMRFVREGLFNGWQDAVNMLLNTPKYPGAHFLKGLHQLAMTLFAINNPVHARRLLLTLIAATDDAPTQSAAYMDLAVISQAEGDAVMGREYHDAASALHDATPYIQDAAKRWQKLAQPLAAAGVAFEQAATVIIPTSISRKIFVNTAKAPPHIDMLAETLESFYRRTGAPRTWPVVICFDQPAAPDLQADAITYRTALEAFVIKNQQCTLKLYKGNGLRKTMMEQVQALRTPYFFFLEHDWLFQDGVAPLETLFRTMELHPQMVHQCRYPSEPVYPNAYDAMLLPGPGATTLTNGISNRPALWRTAKFQRDIIPLIQDDALDTRNFGAGGIEENVYAASSSIYRALGFITGQRAFGTAFAAPLGDTARIVHTGI